MTKTWINNGQIAETIPRSNSISMHGGKLVCTMIIHPSSNQETKMIKMSVWMKYLTNFAFLYSTLSIQHGFVSQFSFVCTIEWAVVIVFVFVFAFVITFCLCLCFTVLCAPLNGAGPDRLCVVPSSLGAGLGQKVTRAGSWMGDQHTGPSQWKVFPIVAAREPWQPYPWIVDICKLKT